MGKKLLIPASIIAASLLLSGAQCTDVTVTTRVDSVRKISSSSSSLRDALVAEDQFGSALTNIGDLEGDGVIDLAVGEPFDDDEGLNRGALWILFMDSDGRVDAKQKISDGEGNFPPDLDDDDRFGSAVAGIGDLDGDAVFDLAVGAPLDDEGGANRGAVWILFLNQDGTVKQTQKLSSESGGFDGDLNDNDHFGSAIAGVGDLDQDGIADLVAGARLDNDGGLDRGALWVLFLNADGTMKAKQKISQTKGGFDGILADGDQFGSAIADIGDLNDDGVTDLAVGADHSDAGGSNRGAVWVLFMKSGGAVLSSLKISDTEGGFNGTISDEARFGAAVAGVGNLDGDGARDFVVGSPFDDDAAADAGAAWVLFMKRTKTESDRGLHF